MDAIAYAMWSIHLPGIPAQYCAMRISPKQALICFVGPTRTH